MGETKRTIRTPEERAAALKEELAKVEAQAEAKRQKRVDHLLDRRSALMAQINERVDKVGEIDVELTELGAEAPVDFAVVENSGDTMVPVEDLRV